MSQPLRGNSWAAPASCRRLLRKSTIRAVRVARETLSFGSQCAFEGGDNEERINNHSGGRLPDRHDEPFGPRGKRFRRRVAGQGHGWETLRDYAVQWRRGESNARRGHDRYMEGRG